jgi:hypothetical protein
LSRPRRSLQARHEFRESPPGKAGFRISGQLLGGSPPLFDQLQKRLAAASQALASLEFVDQRDRFPRQRHDQLSAACRRQTAAVGTVLVIGWHCQREHGRTLVNDFASARGYADI